MSKVAFVGSTFENVRLSRLSPRSCISRPSWPPPHRAHLPRDSGSAGKHRRPSAALEKRQRSYFFKLVSAARNRDKRLLLAVVTALGKDKDYLQAKSADGASDPLHLEDVLLKAASRCGQTDLADMLFKVKGMKSGCSWSDCDCPWRVGDHWMSDQRNLDVQR